MSKSLDSWRGSGRGLAFYDDGVFRHQCRYCSQGSEFRSDKHSNGCHGNWNFNESVACRILYDEALDVAFMEECLYLIHQIPTKYLNFFH